MAGNRLAKVLLPNRTDQVRVNYITHTNTGEGWWYLAGILDACTYRLVGGQTGESLDAG